MNQGLVQLLKAKQLLRVMSSQSASTYANQVIAFVIPWLVLRDSNPRSRDPVPYHLATPHRLMDAVEDARGIAFSLY